MPRKARARAEAETNRAHEARLQYASRNPEFRGAVDSLIKLRNALPGRSDEVTLERVHALGGLVAELQRVAKEWGLAFGVVNALSDPRWHEGLSPHESIPAASVHFDSPVIAWTILPTLPGMDLPQQDPEEARYLKIKVDLNYPVDSLLPLIEAELSRYSREYRGGARRRLKGVGFHLQVFDLVAESDESFPAIARKLKRPLSNVKSAYLAAHRNIL
jgi:hypothetical protein